MCSRENGESVNNVKPCLSCIMYCDGSASLRPSCEIPYSIMEREKMVMKKGVCFIWCMGLFAAMELFGQSPAFAGAVTYIYDDAGRLTKAKYDNGKTIEYTYDKAGNLLEQKVSESSAVCEVDALELSSAKLKLKKEEKKEVTVTVQGKDGCATEGEIVTTHISAAHMKLVEILPTEQVTDGDGEATFTVTNTGKTGNAVIKFTCNSKTTALNIRVGK